MIDRARSGGTRLGGLLLGWLISSPSRRRCKGKFRFVRGLLRASSRTFICPKRILSRPPCSILPAIISRSVILFISNIKRAAIIK